MNSKVSLRTLFAVIAVVAVALAVWMQGQKLAENQRLRQENQLLRERLDLAKFDLDMARLDTLLKVPTEALYTDYKSRGELDRIRWQALKENGAEEEFIPVYLLYAHRPEDPSTNLDQQIGMRRWANSQDNFWEGYAINHADDGVQRLVTKLKSPDDFRSRLMADAELRDDYLKPLLMRMVRSPEQRSRLAAIEAMLLLSDQRTEVMAAIRDDLERLSGSPPLGLQAGIVLGDEHAKSLLKDYHRLIREHKLNIPRKTESAQAEAAAAKD